MFRIIWDNGKPSCLPQWARDEIVRRRLNEAELQRQNKLLLVDLQVAKDALKDATQHMGWEAK